MRMFVIKDSRYWTSLIKIRDAYPNFSKSQTGNLNFDVDICSWSFCPKAVHRNRFNEVQDGDSYDPYDIQELFSGNGEIEGLDEEHRARPPNSSSLTFTFLNSPVEDFNDLGGSGKTVCNGDSRFCRLRYNEASFAGTHNSVSGADERFRKKDFQENCNIADQTTGLEQQLSAGIRYRDVRKLNISSVSRF